MGMMKQVRAPSMEHSEKTDLGAQVLGISGDGEQGLRRGPEQDAIELSLILVGDGSGVGDHGATPRSTTRRINRLKSTIAHLLQPAIFRPPTFWRSPRLGLFLETPER